MNRNGFTLIELMIVVGIIGILAAIAIPNMLRARTEANEASAIGDLRVIGAAQVTYNSARNTYGDFAALTTEVAGPGSGLLQNDWSEGRKKSGYTFTMPSVTATSFECFADPAEVGVTGVRYFRVDASGVVRYDKTGRPDSEDPQVGG